MDAKKILENGVETTATLIDIGSSMSGSETYYWLKFSFVNSEGETITCKTKSLYPNSFITESRIAGHTPNSKFELTGEPVQVKYIGEKAVLKEYIPKEDKEWTNWLAPGFFGAIGALILLGLALGPVIGMFPVVQQIIAFLGLVFVGFVFAGIGAGVYLWVLKPPMDAAKILKNGAETTANVVEVIDSKISTTTTTSSGSSKEIISNRLYRLTLAFVNSKGEEVIHKTGSIYTGSFIKNLKIAENETAQVMYVGNKAIVKGYEPESNDGWLWIFPIVFGAIGVAIWLTMAWGIVKATNDFIIKKHGVESIGIYLRYEEIKYHKKEVETEAPACNIYFTFENQHGETVEVQTGYLSYHVHEAEALAAMRTFPIKYKGKKAIIMVDKKELVKT